MWLSLKVCREQLTFKEHSSSLRVPGSEKSSLGGVRNPSFSSPLNTASERQLTFTQCARYFMVTVCVGAVAAVTNYHKRRGFKQQSRGQKPKGARWLNPRCARGRASSRLQARSATLPFPVPGGARSSFHSLRARPLPVFRTLVMARGHPHNQDLSLTTPPKALLSRQVASSWGLGIRRATSLGRCPASPPDAHRMICSSR